MKTIVCGISLTCVLALLVPCSVWAADVLVDCSGATPGAFTSIGAALATLSVSEPNSITVTGTCVENPKISFMQRLNIVGAGSAVISPANPGQRVFDIVGSRGVELEGLTISGGVVLREASSATIFRCTIENSASHGIIMRENSWLYLQSSTVRNNGGNGINVNGGQLSIYGGVTVEGNARSGVLVYTAYLNLLGDVAGGNQNYVRNNGGIGIVVYPRGVAIIGGDNFIQNNAGSGVYAAISSAVFMDGGTIEGNGQTGVVAEETSHGELFGVTVRNNGAAHPTARGGVRVGENSGFYLDGGVNFSNNTGPGVLVEFSSVFTTLGGNTIADNTEDGVKLVRQATGHYYAPDVISGNAGASLLCDSTSLLVGDIGGVGNVRCPRIERELGPPRPGPLKP